MSGVNDGRKTADAGRFGPNSRIVGVAFLGAFLGPALLACGMIGTASAQQNRVARGMVEPRIEATLSSQVAARVERVAVDRGQRVAKGDELVAFDCALERARLKAAEAERDGAIAKLDSLRRLDKMRSVGRVDVELAAADAARTRAAVEERGIVVERCVVLAPFDGLVIDVPIHADESVEAGKPLVSLLDDRSLRLAILAPSDWTAWVRPGMPLSFVVDETGEKLSAVVSHLGARIDATSQTIPVFASITREKGPAAGDEPPLIAGMTGSAGFPAALGGGGH